MRNPICVLFYLFLGISLSSAEAKKPMSEAEELKWLFEVNAMNIAASMHCGEDELASQIRDSFFELLLVHPLSDPRLMGVNRRTFDDKIGFFHRLPTTLDDDDGKNCPEHIEMAKGKLKYTDRLIVKYVHR
jgi:hypothetical protein